MSDPNNPGQPLADLPPGSPSYPQAPPPPAFGSTPPPPAPPYGSYAVQGGPPYPPAYGVPANPYAHWGVRVGAYLLDAVLILPFSIVAIIAMAVGEDTATGEINPAGVLIAVAAYVGGIGFTIWNHILRQGRTGSSLGKGWLGIRVVHERNGEPLGGWLTFGRSLLHILDALACYVGFLWPLWDAKRQTFADKIVKSVVLKGNQPAG